MIFSGLEFASGTTYGQPMGNPWATHGQPWGNFWYFLKTIKVPKVISSFINQIASVKAIVKGVINIYNSRPPGNSIQFFVVNGKKVNLEYTTKFFML